MWTWSNLSLHSAAALDDVEGNKPLSSADISGISGKEVEIRPTIF